MCKEHQLEGQKTKLLIVIAAILIAGFLISLIPIIIAAFYSHPTVDDFGYSAGVHQAVKNGGGFFDVLKASFQKVYDTYFDWQGTYAAIFIFSIQPAAFSENLYFITTIVMLAALIASTGFFILTVFKTLKFNRTSGIIISCIILLLSIHFVVDKCQAFYWWNGCSYYTVFYAFSLTLFSLLIRLYSAKKLCSRILCFIFSLLLSILIGGGNYSTALFSTVIFVFAIAMLLAHKKSVPVYFYIILAVLLAGFIISMAAPGNNVRATHCEGNSPVKAIILSIMHSIMYIIKWTGFAQIACFLIIAGFAFILTKKINYSFNYPFLVFVVTALIYATQFTPALYALGFDGPARMMNVYYYSYYLFVLINIFYFCGWVNKRKFITVSVSRIKKSYYAFGLLFILGLFAVGCLHYRLDVLTFGDTTLALLNGTPQAYSAEYMENVYKIESGNTEIVEMKTVPDFFATLEIDEDPNFWSNRQMAQYYNVERITLKR